MKLISPQILSLAIFRREGPTSWAVLAPANQLPHAKPNRLTDIGPCSHYLSGENELESTTRSHHTTLAAYMGPHGSDRLTAAQPANRRRQFPPPSSTPLLRVESLTTLVSSLSKDTSFHFFFFSPSSPPAPLLRSCSAALAWILPI